MELDWKEAVKKPIPAKVVQLTEELWNKVQAEGETSDERVDVAYPENSEEPEAKEIAIGEYKLVATYTNAVKGDDENGYQDNFAKGWLVQTLEDVDGQKHQAKIDDYLIQGNKNEIWAIDKEVFEETYEWIDENTIKDLADELEELLS